MPEESTPPLPPMPPPLPELGPSFPPPPPQPLSSPPSAAQAEIHENADRWYLPTWWDRLVLMNWRVIYFLPALIVIALFFIAPFAMIFWWKLLVPAVGLPLAAAVTAAKNAVKLRKEPFCIHCGYDLTSLPDGHRCPECGVPFHLVEIDDYRRDPHWFIQRRRAKTPLPQAGAAIEAGPRRSPKSRDGT